MGDLTPHFSRFEFACRGVDCCGASAPIHPLLVESLEALRKRIGKPLKISSGFRCRRHNARVGGSPRSLHTLAMAADALTPDGISPSELAALAENIQAFREGGIGIYKAWVHLDVRDTGRARWKQ